MTTHTHTDQSGTYAYTVTDNEVLSAVCNGVESRAKMHDNGTVFHATGSHYYTVSDRLTMSHDGSECVLDGRCYTLQWLALESN